MFYGGICYSSFFYFLNPWIYAKTSTAKWTWCFEHPTKTLGTASFTKLTESSVQTIPQNWQSSYYVLGTTKGTAFLESSDRLRVGYVAKPSGAYFNLIGAEESRGFIFSTDAEEENSAKICREVSRYLKERTANLTSPPLAYWEADKPTCPHFAELSRKYLSSPFLFPASSSIRQPHRGFSNKRIQQPQKGSSPRPGRYWNLHAWD